MYIGSGHGNLYMDATSLQRTFWKYEENTVNGFYPYNGAYPTINKGAINVLYYPTKTYDPYRGTPTHVLDFSNENTKTWRLDTPDKTRNIKETLSELGTGLITYSKSVNNRFSNTVIKEVQTDNTSDKSPKKYTIALNTYNSNKFIYDFKYVPTYSAVGLKLYEDYGFVTEMVEKVIDLDLDIKLLFHFQVKPI